MFLRFLRSRWRVPKAIGAIGFVLPMVLVPHVPTSDWQDL